MPHVKLKNIFHFFSVTICWSCLLFWSAEEPNLRSRNMYKWVTRKSPCGFKHTASSTTRFEWKTEGHSTEIILPKWPADTSPTHHYSISETPQHLSAAMRDQGGIMAYRRDERKHVGFGQTCTHAAASLPEEQEPCNGDAVSCQLMAGCHN